MGNIESAAGIGLLPQLRHDLQDRRACKRWRWFARLVESIAHCALWNQSRSVPASAPLPKFAQLCGTLVCELRKQRGTSNLMILVPLFDLRSLTESAANVIGTSNRRH